jgi:dTDP-L-rhamnose 4-epimerase
MKKPERCSPDPGAGAGVKGRGVAERILVTGGAGFIGRHLCNSLLQAGHAVRVLDSLIPQVHGEGCTRPALLNRDVELHVGDVCDAAAMRRALTGIDAVVHLAAEVGVGQSMYALDRYVSTNDRGTAMLLQHLIERPVRRVVVASSMSIYGEGLYQDRHGRLIENAVRGTRQAGAAGWDPTDLEGCPMVPVPTPEWKRPSLASVYAITKYVQERLVLAVAPAYGMQAVALRLWNAYGSGQALGNPYTGVLAIFASRLHRGAPPLVFEDGKQQRDFVHVSDVVDAFLLALNHPAAAGQVFNIASGEARSVEEVALVLAHAMGRAALRPEITQQARAGDVRHCIPDIGLAKRELGYAPRRSFRDGVAELTEWVARQTEAEDRVQQARQELEMRGLVA